jgi:glutamate formiminotransferase
MSGRLIECVPNFSEGRDRGVVAAIERAIAATPGVAVLGAECDADHHRSVITFAGEPAAVVEGALAGAAEAVRRIDLNRHRGVHPRIGALDVLPFVPLSGAGWEDAIAAARRAGERLWSQLGVPVYFYEAAARRAERRNLAEVRRGQFEGLRNEAITDPARAPDVGGPGLHPTAGATAVGVRRFLIAYNINLDTADVRIARRIAGKIRASSGGFPHVKALGLELASRRQAQVSMNLTDFEATPVECVFEAVEAEAARCGVAVASSEIIGFIPRRAYEMAPGFYERAANFRPELILENRLAAVRWK